MFFTVNGKALQQHVKAVYRVINPKCTLKILDCFLITVKDSILYITGSDSETVLTASLEVSFCDTDGSIAISAKKLLDIVREIGDQPINFDIDETTCAINIKFATGHFSFTGFSAASFPIIQFDDTDVKNITLSADSLITSLKNTSYAIADATSVRPIMQGVLCDFREDEIVFAGTDCHRLVRYSLLKNESDYVGQFVIPSKSLGILSNLLSSDMGDIDISVTPKSGIFQFGVYKFQTLFVQGIYPNIERVIPQDVPLVASFEKEDMIQALRRVNLFLSESVPCVKLDLSENTLKLSSTDPEYSKSAYESIPCNYSGDNISIGFNGNFLLSVISNFPISKINLNLRSPERPGVFTPTEPNDTDKLTTILLPLNIA